MRWTFIQKIDYWWRDTYEGAINWKVRETIYLSDLLNYENLEDFDAYGLVKMLEHPEKGLPQRVCVEYADTKERYEQQNAEHPEEEKIKKSFYNVPIVYTQTFHIGNGVYSIEYVHARGMLKPCRLRDVSLLYAHQKRKKMNKGITKICIINHWKHEVYIETVSDTELQEKYNGEEEKYVKDKYGITDEQLKNGEFTWDWFVNITAFGVVKSILPMFNFC